MRTMAMILALAASAWAAPPGPPRTEAVRIGGALKVPAHDLVQLSAEGLPPGATVFWSVTPKLRPSQLKRGAGTLDFAAAPGRYLVSLRAVWIADKATLALAGEEVEAEVVVGDAPIPPPPGPADPLQAVLQKAYEGERDPAARDKLAAVWKVAGTTTASDPAVTAWPQLMKAVADAGRALAGDPATVLPATRKALAAHLASVLPKDGDLDGAGRARAAAEFARAARCLEGLR